MIKNRDKNIELITVAGFIMQLIFKFKKIVRKMKAKDYGY